MGSRITALSLVSTMVACGGTTSSGSGETDGTSGHGGTEHPSGGGGSHAGGVQTSGGSAGAGGAAGASGGGMPGAGGASGAAGRAGSGGLVSGGTGGAGGAGSAGRDAGSTCDAPCMFPFECCDGRCANTANDPQNCGGCGIQCPHDAPLCDGVCSVPICGDEGTGPVPTCDSEETCCGLQCCGSGQLCCSVQFGGATTGWNLGCYDPVDGTCPVGCPFCVCASPDTPIATPSGERAIATLAVGDVVLSVNHGRLAAAPLIQVHRTAAREHHVVRVVLEDTQVLEISAPHPTADGRRFGDLRAGDAIDGRAIGVVEVVPYQHDFTYDILPATDSGTYVAGGVLIGSTLGGSPLLQGDHAVCLVKSHSEMIPTAR